MDCRASNLQPYQPSLWPKTATSGSERGTKDCGSSTAGISTGRYRPVRSGPDNSNIRSSTGNCPCSESLKIATDTCGSARTGDVSNTFHPTGISKPGSGSTIPTTEMIPIRYAPISRRTSTPIPSPTIRPSGSEPARG